MLAKIGAAVAAERRRQGLEQDDLGVDAKVVAALEQGLPGITTVQFRTLAEALQVDAVALRRGEIVAMPLPSVYLRHNAHQDFDGDDAAVLDEAMEQARNRNALARLATDDVGLFPRRTFKEQPSAADSPTAPARDGYRLAHLVRKELGNKTQALADLAELTEGSVGIAVLVRSLRTLGSTAVGIKAGDAAAIVLTPAGASREGGVVRGLIAHELCHVLFDPASGTLNIVIDYENDRRSLHAEQRARAFAAELLVPEAGVKALIGAPRHVREKDAACQLVAMIRDHYGASWQITANHLCNLGFIELGLREWLERTPPWSATRPWQTKLPIEGATSLRLASLTQVAHEGGKITDGEARAVLGIDALVALPWDRE